MLSGSISAEVLLSLEMVGSAASWGYTRIPLSLALVSMEGNPGRSPGSDC